MTANQTFEFLSLFIYMLLLFPVFLFGAIRSFAWTDGKRFSGGRYVVFFLVFVLGLMVIGLVLRQISLRAMEYFLQIPDRLFAKVLV